jgi:hypothetical protein
MNKAGYSFCLCKPEYRKAAVSSHSNHRIRPELSENGPYLKKTFDKLERQPDVFYQRTSVEPGYIQALDLITGLRHFFHFHFTLRPNKKDLDSGLFFLQGICNGYGGKNMSSRSSACYNDLFVQPRFLLFLLGGYRFFIRLLTLYLFHISRNAQNDAYRQTGEQERTSTHTHQW